MVRSQTSCKAVGVADGRHPHSTGLAAPPPCAAKAGSDRSAGDTCKPSANLKPLSAQGRLKVRHKAAGAAMLVAVLSGLLPSVGRPRCHW